MDELISRQAAIDALKELTANGTNKGMVFGEDAVHRIEMLPSAQPEIIRCKDCANWSKNTEFCLLWSMSNVARRTLSDDFCSRAERRTDG